MRFRWKTRPWLTLLITTLATLALLLLLISLALSWFLHDQADSLVASSAFRTMIERATDKGLKLEGHYAPLHRTSTWSVATSSYTSIGRPGEAIAFLDASDIRATFDPWGILRRQWTVSQIDIARARIGLQPPNDALKIPFPPGKRPWYAFLLPTRFVPVVTTCPNTDLTFSFLGHDASATGLSVQVFPYGLKDWRIVGSGGTLSMHLLPPLHIQNLEFITARTFLDFQNFLLLSPPGNGSSRVEGRARLGMHEDTSLRFSVRIADLPLTYALPGKLGEAISGSANGWVTYHRPGKTRHGEDGSGQIVIDNLTVANLPLQHTIANFTSDSAFTQIQFQSLSCAFTLRDRAFTIPSLRLSAPGLIDMHGRLSGSANGRIDLDMTLNDFPLNRWLPAPIQRHLQGHVTGRFLAEGHPDDLRQLNAWTFLQLDQGSLDQLPLLRPLYARLGIHALRTLRFDRAQFEMSYGADLWELKSFTLDASRLIRSHGYASLDPSGSFTLFAQLHTPNLHPLLPPAWRGSISGSARTRLALRGSTAQPQQTRATAAFDLSGLTLRRLKLQADLARFFNDPAWLDARFTQLQGTLHHHNGSTRLDQLHAHIPGRLGLTGHLTLHPDQTLSGQLQLGCAPQIIDWLGPAGHRLFPEQRDQLYWTPVLISGTLHRPENDLLPRLRSAILSDPGLLLKTAFKALSWILGDWFTPDRFRPPPAPAP
ncbi:MAG: hypothetical protein SNJ84_04420 [Verrucomicrobiia bacterium]